jgi:hypothetical protein
MLDMRDTLEKLHRALTAGLDAIVPTASYHWWTPAVQALQDAEHCSAASCVRSYSAQVAGQIIFSMSGLGIVVAWSDTRERFGRLRQ